MMSAIDTPEHIYKVREILDAKPFLRKLYREYYENFRLSLKNTPPGGLVLELGSGASFIKDVVPETITTDTLAYPHVDQVVDATNMPYADSSLRAVFLMNVLHHIPNTEAFFSELRRCLKPGGLALIVDQHRGLISEPILKYSHHEPYEPNAKEWNFQSSGPLSGANGALAWIIFKRDALRFAQLYPELSVSRYETHTPLRYWLSGGLKSWCLVPSWGFSAATQLDRMLTKLHPSLGSFVSIELRRL